MDSSDSVYANGGDYFSITEPTDQSNARKTEKAFAEAGRGMIERIIKHVDEQIAHLSSIESLAVDVADDPLTHQKMCAANMLSINFLRGEKSYLEGLLEK